MLGYVLPGASPESAAQDPRMRRLAHAGPWQFHPHPDGVLATWRTADGFKPTFGESRKTIDGLIYHSPKELPSPESLTKDEMTGRMDVSKVTVDSVTGPCIIHILPAYYSPRRILDTNNLGDFAAVYARRARIVMGMLATGKDDDDATKVYEELFDCCRDAIMFTTRCTKELITDCGWLNETSVWEIWKAVTHVPKDSRGSGDEPSGRNSQPAASKT